MKNLSNKVLLTIGKQENGSGYQTFLDANEIVDASSIDQEDKSDAKDKVLLARKCAVGNKLIYMLHVRVFRLYWNLFDI